MSIIGSGPGIITGPAAKIAAVLTVGASDRGHAPQAATAAARRSDSVAATAPVVTSTALAAGAAPVDQDRVTAIRKAIETDNYPVLPTKIGDAMIAAGMLLRMRK